MKLILVSFAVVLITLLVLLPMSSGLDCYECVAGDGLNDADKYHKQCKEGDLPNDIDVTCTLFNARDAETRKLLNATQVELSQKQGLADLGCGKLQGKVNNDEITIKGCIFDNRRPDKQNFCEETTLAVGGSTGKGTGCVCYTDKCNGAGTCGAQAGSVILAVIAVVTRIGV